MGSLFRSAVTFGLAAGLGLPVSAQAEHCTHDNLSLDSAAIVARFCVPPDARAPSVEVTEFFSTRGKTVQKTVSLAVVDGARTSRTIDDFDLAPLGIARSLHMTLAFHAGSVVLEHALALPGAIPLK